jgi:hypothetical protein
MKRELTLAVCGFALLAVSECPVLLAQAEPAKPVSKASDLSIQTCDSLKNPALGESSTDAANRRKAWWHCLEKRPGTPEVAMRYAWFAFLSGFSSRKRGKARMIRIASAPAKRRVQAGPKWARPWPNAVRPCEPQGRVRCPPFPSAGPASGRPSGAPLQTEQTGPLPLNRWPAGVVS